MGRHGHSQPAAAYDLLLSRFVDTVGTTAQTTKKIPSSDS